MSDVQAAQPATVAAPSAACPMCKKTHTDSYAKALDRLKKGPRLLAKALRGLKEKNYDRSYGAGKWSIREIICHLRDCEVVYGFRYRKMIAEDNAELVAFDQDRFATQTAYARQDARAAVDAFTALREANVELLKIGGKSVVGRGGKHAEYGPISVEQLVRHIVEHDRNHLGQIELARKTKPAKKDKAKDKVKIKEKKVQA